MEIADKVLIRPGRLPPGYKLETLSGVNIEGHSSVIYQGKFCVLYYDADSGEKTVVNTEIYGVLPKEGRTNWLLRNGMTGFAFPPQHFETKMP